MGLFSIKLTLLFLGGIFKPRSADSGRPPWANSISHRGDKLLFILSLSKVLRSLLKVAFFVIAKAIRDANVRMHANDANKN